MSLTKQNKQKEGDRNVHAVHCTRWNKAAVDCTQDVTTMWDVSKKEEKKLTERDMMLEAKQNKNATNNFRDAILVDKGVSFDQ